MSSEITAESQDAQAQDIPLVQIGASSNTSVNASPIAGVPTVVASEPPPVTLNGGTSTTSPSHRNESAAKRGPGFVKRDPAVQSPQWPTEVE
jgi:hypothetical protein